MFAMVDWQGLAAVAGVIIAIIYPALGIIWRWIRHTEDRFDELRDGINELKNQDTVDVRDLQTFKDDVGRRLQRLEDHVYR